MEALIVNFIESNKSGLLDIARAAGARILKDFGRSINVVKKSDGSPSTSTDLAAEQIIVDFLQAHSDFQIIAEEAFSNNPNMAIDYSQPFWLVDALDGTRSFLKGEKDFTINIALVIDKQPAFGIVYAPAFDLMFHATHGSGAWCNDRPLQMLKADPMALHVLGGMQSSASPVLEPFIGEHCVTRRDARSSALKFGLLAINDGHLYPRLGPTCEWDTAAGDIILRESGGVILDIQTRRPLAYGKDDKKLLNNGFVAGARTTFLAL